MKRTISAEQKVKLSQAQLAYIANDARWAQHRQKLADAQRRPKQRARLSATTKAYIDTDPRWPEHRARMQDAALEVTKLTLLPEELARIVELRAKGRTFEYLSEEFCVSEKVIRRELQANGHSTERIKRRRATRGTGYWRSFDTVAV